MTRIGDARGSWFFSGWVAIVLLVVIPPLWITLALTRQREDAMRLVHRWARRVFAVCGCPLSVSGFPHLDRPHCAIIVANHASYLDSVVLLAILACDFRFVANRASSPGHLWGSCSAREGTSSSIGTQSNLVRRADGRCSRRSITARRWCCFRKGRAPRVDCSASRMAPFGPPSEPAHRSFPWPLQGPPTSCLDTADCFAVRTSTSRLGRPSILRMRLGQPSNFVNTLQPLLPPASTNHEAGTSVLSTACRIFTIR